MASSRSPAMFLAAVLLLAAAVAASAKAQAAAPPCSCSPCPPGLVSFVRDSFPNFLRQSPLPKQVKEITRLLSCLTDGDAARCVCDGILAAGIRGRTPGAPTSIVGRILAYAERSSPAGFKCFSEF